MFLSIYSLYQEMEQFKTDRKYRKQRRNCQSLDRLHFSAASTYKYDCTKSRLCANPCIIANDFVNSQGLDHAVQ